MEWNRAVINDRTREETTNNVDNITRYRNGIVELTPDMSRGIAWHWHMEVEYICVRSGALTCHIPGAEYTFHAGDVLFLNSGVLHRISLPDQTGCVLQNHIFLPRLIYGDSAGIEAAYVTPLTRNSAAPLLFFSADTQEAEEIRRWMNEAYTAHTDALFAHELIVRDCLSRVWAVYAAHMPPVSARISTEDSQRLMLMLRYIQDHYAEKLSLETLAQVVHTSSKECERCFKRQIKLSPFEYIMEYRLEKARSLILQMPRLHITEIGQQCGFATTSYFGKCFRSKYGVSPREYRASLSKP